jgi:hypothetical protein
MIAMMRNNPILQLPLARVMRPEIALPLQQVLQVYTVGNFLVAWRDPRGQRQIEQIFDTPAQARHAVSVCATWLGVPNDATLVPTQAWWINDDSPDGLADVT